MQNVSRIMQTQIVAAAKSFAAVVLTGPRRCGKTFLLRQCLKGASYVLLEDPDVLLRVRADPRSFIDGLKLPVILDEIQNAPELFAYIRTRIDAAPRKMGQWFLTGSQEAPLMQGVSESMAGRAAVFQMLPIAREESSKVSMLNGGFPEVLARPAARSIWFSSYIQTYLERDVRAVLNVRNLSTFRRFLALCAARHGQILNRSDFAAPLGLSVPAISEWLGVLETTGLLLMVPPYFSNLGKRIVKSPKIYLCDSGLTCHLLGIQTQAELLRSPFLGAITEGVVAAEIVKAQINRGIRRELYYFRDQQGLEVDFLFPHRGVTVLAEVKTSSTPVPAMTKPLQQLARSFAQLPTRSVLIHGDSRSVPKFSAVAPGVEARTLDGLIAELF
jgi:uncharacterized protein